MLFFVTLFPPEDLSKKIDDIRSQYDADYKKLAPHITIIPPFSPKEDIRSYISALNNVISNIQSFDVTIQGIGTFNGNKNVVYLDVNEPPELMELQKSIFFALEGCGATLGKHRHTPNFHITIAKNLTTRSVESILKELESINFYENFTIEKISLCAKNESGPWTIYKDFYLK
jgi:2'-5' RNA ligase